MSQKLKMVGRVVSVKMSKTAVVLVDSKKTHPVYGKTYKWSKKYIVDDPMGVGLGDVVIFEKVRPISKMKHWQIKKVLGKDIVSLEQAELAEDAAEAIAEVLPEEEDEKDQVSVLGSPLSEKGESVVSESDKKVKTEKPKTEKPAAENGKQKTEDKKKAKKETKK
jgi:small subunit ribosomal protein S17